MSTLTSPPAFTGMYHPDDGFFLIDPTREMLGYLNEYRQDRDWDEIPGVSFWEAKSSNPGMIDFLRFRDRFVNSEYGVVIDPVFIGWRPVEGDLAMLLRLAIQQP